MAKLHASWSQINAEYTRLWNHAYAEGAEQELEDLIRREQELSELAATDAPNDRKRLGRWQDHVIRIHNLVYP